MQEAFAIAIEQWPKQGPRTIRERGWFPPRNHKAVDLLRRRMRFDSKRDELQRLAEVEQHFSEAEESMLASG